MPNNSPNPQPTSPRATQPATFHTLQTTQPTVHTCPCILYGYPPSAHLPLHSSRLEQGHRPTPFGTLICLSKVGDSAELGKPRPCAGLGTLALQLGMSAAWPEGATEHDGVALDRGMRGAPRHADSTAQAAQ